MERYKEYLIGAGLFFSLATAPAIGQTPEEKIPEQEVRQQKEKIQNEESSVKEEKGGENKLERPIKFHVAQDEGYSREGFSLAEEYLEEEVGLDVEFIFHGEELPGYVELDHLRNFAIKEITTDERINMLLENAKRPAENPNIEGREEFQETIMNAMRHYSTSKGAEAHPRESTIYLLEDEDKTERDMSLPEKILNSGGEDVDPYKAKNEALKLVHETGHIVGLIHPNDFPDTDIPKAVDGRINAMCRLLPPVGGKYGFDLTEEQLETMRSYFSKGRQFQVFKENKFNTFSYLDYVERSEGYQDRGEGIIERLTGN